MKKIAKAVLCAVCFLFGALLLLTYLAINFYGLAYGVIHRGDILSGLIYLLAPGLTFTGLAIWLKKRGADQS